MILCCIFIRSWLFYAQITPGPVKWAPSAHIKHEVSSHIWCGLSIPFLAAC